MVQGKVERFGWRESFRIEENAKIASEKESPLRARSVITAFQPETLLLSTYFRNMLVRFAFLALLLHDDDDVAAVECLRLPSIDVMILEMDEIIVS